MNDLDSDVKSQLAKLKEERDASKAQQIIDNGEVPQVDAGPPTEAEAAPTPVESVVDEKKEEISTTNPPPPAEESPVETSENEDSSDEIKFEWDVDSTEVKPISLDLQKIGSALNLEASNEEDFVKTVSEKFTKLKEYEEKSSTENSLPLDFKQAFDEAKSIASQGGDWQTAIFSSLGNVAALDSLSLFDQEFEKINGQNFKKEDGTIDRDALFAEIDQIPEGVRKMQGEQIKQRLLQVQQQRKQAVQQALSQSYENFNKSLNDAVKTAAEAFPKDKWGITLEPQHLNAIRDGIANGKLVQKHLGSSIDVSTLSKFDAAKLVKTVISAEISEKAAQFNYKKGKSDGKREILERTQNPQIETPGKAAAPDLADDKKPKTSTEKLKDMARKFQPENSL